MTTFPFLGVITAYEARRSLWTLCRQMPIVITTIITIMVVTRLPAPRVGLGWSLVAAWAVFLAFILPVLLRQAAVNKNGQRAGAAGSGRPTRLPREGKLVTGRLLSLSTLQPGR